ncbi:MAG: hypothetical protein OJF50_005308 [Nitrospira sp.]|nr:hypothetical protein [Nitrospira sp.]
MVQAIAPPLDPPPLDLTETVPCLPQARRRVVVTAGRNGVLSLTAGAAFSRTDPDI